MMTIVIFFAIFNILSKKLKTALFTTFVHDTIPAITAGTMKHPIPPIPTVIRRIANKVRLLTKVAMAPDPPASKMATIKAFLRPYLSLTKPIVKDPKTIFIFKKSLTGNKC